MRYLKIILRIFLFCFLTVLTQVGGLVYLLSIFTNKYTDKWSSTRTIRIIYRFSVFITFYLSSIFLIVPLIAKPFGRVPLPLKETNHLQPLNILTCLLNRNYVRPELRQIAFNVAKKMNQKFQGTTVNYLDANFPFINKFPLIPHLSHNDGKKLDVSFFYLDSKTKEPTNECPSSIGYGISEEPMKSEENTTDFCEKKGYWQYSFLTKIIPQSSKKDFIFDKDRTKDLVNFFATQESIGKIFIEPHLLKRLNLTSNKIRFHGCQAVRHDDHIHVQLL